MKTPIRSLLAGAASLIMPKRAELLAAPALIRRGRMATRDVAYQFRMGTGFAGDVNRTHPFNVVARFPNAANPPTFYGQPVILVNDGSVRAFAAGDDAVTDIYGVTVRPYPLQQSTTNQPYAQVLLGDGGLPATQAVDILVMGFIMVPVVGDVVPGGSPFVWIAASAGGHTLGGFESADAGGDTASITWEKTKWHSPNGEDGIAELAVNI